MANGDNNGHWHLDKRFSWGHIITTLGMIGAAVFWFTGMDSRVQVVENDIVDIRQDDDRHEQYAKDQLIRLENMMNAQTKRLEGRMEAQYSEIIRRLEILDQRMVENNKADAKNHTQ